MKIWKQLRKVKNKFEEEFDDEHGTPLIELYLTMIKLLEMRIESKDKLIEQQAEMIKELINGN